MLTVALMFLLIAFGRQKSLSRIFFNAAGDGDKMNIAGIIHFDEYYESVKEIT